MGGPYSEQIYIYIYIECKHSVCKVCDFLPVERSAIVAEYQMLPHLAQAQDARASARLQDLQSTPATAGSTTRVLFE